MSAGTAYLRAFLEGTMSSEERELHCIRQMAAHPLFYEDYFHRIKIPATRCFRTRTGLGQRADAPTTSYNITGRASAADGQGRRRRMEKPRGSRNTAANNTVRLGVL